MSWGRPPRSPVATAATCGDAWQRTARRCRLGAAEDGRMKNGAIAVPGPCHVAILLAPPALQESHQDQEARAQILGIIVQRGGLAGPAGDSVRTSGALQEELERRAICLDPGADLRIGLGPGGRRGRIDSVRPEGKGATLLVRPPEEDECIPVLGDAEGAESCDIERVADIRQPVQTRQPPDRDGRRGDREADRQDERGPQQMAEPLAQQW